MDYRLPLRNKDGNVVDYALVSQEDYPELNKFKWYMTTEGYARSDKIGLIHCYIMYNVLNNEKDAKKVVDHINSNKLDNRRENLRMATHSENARNRSKSNSAHSKYTGVCFEDNRSKKWSVSIKISDDLSLLARFESELHAAWQYNLWVKEHKLECAKQNDIAEPDDFKPFEKRQKNLDLPKGIYFQKNKFAVSLTINKKHRRFGSYFTVEEAVKARDKIKDDYKKSQENIKVPILRNEHGQVVIQIFDKKKVLKAETIVDEEMYEELSKFKFTYGRYVRIKVDRKPIPLHRYIMNYSGENFVDHINGNPLDNRKLNLRITTPQQNGMNKQSRKNSTSEYIGVSFNKKQQKWRGSIVVDGKGLHLGSFDTEREAALARDIATKKYYGEYGKLNF